ncbi:MAG: asparagine synthase (glutamine-hydrolyzing) [Acidobacteria bacterium]|uniref:asparagine synthase (glutamine-hydrolyzing) n=1 Tax=Candidatus Polarisedimenticola svalbardensis TaxID=2886004 RepID=A0A8J6Y5R0_9BACT|nr:asparagine synthase (glutamine-hydrolyzing) [Candidatus Polarisedimenticola svalbardensis]
MCGICGHVDLDRRPVDPEPVQVMLDAMVHRGPDAGGMHQAPGIVAGIRRLAVIDPEHGDQPISSEDGGVTVVFNGEIYNFRELREDLERRGHAFRTGSDTEVLVHLWEEHGPEMVHRLNGMFAFCIHENNTGRTFIARDRLGIKPLYYRLHGRSLIFASEISVLLRHPGVGRTVDMDALPLLYAMQYLPGDRTIQQDVRKLLPGHWILAESGEATIREYYRIPTPQPGEPVSKERLAEELRELLEDAVRCRTMADVPLGMFLSGGVDSGVVLSLLAAATDRPVRTFSVGFDGPERFDERKYARLLAERYGSEHEELVVSAADIGRMLPEMVQRLDEPVTDPAMIPTWLLSEFARREVTVVLTGEGADELFAGYRRYLYQKKYGWFSGMPGARSLADSALGRSSPGRAGQALAALAEPDAGLNHLYWSMIVPVATAGNLFGQDRFKGMLQQTASGFDRYFDGAKSRLSGSLVADQNEWLPHNLLAKVDRATMAFSLEARVPFLDHRVLEWTSRLQDRYRIDGGLTKAILRHAFRKDLPQEILNRPKRGFDLPLGDWIRGPLRELTSNMFSDASLARWEGLDAGAARRMLARHLAGGKDLGLPLFNLLSILLFLERRAG